MKYTLDELNHLFAVRLKGFNKNESLDDNFTNAYDDFCSNVGTFLDWIAKMEQENKIEHLLKTK